MTVTAKVPVVLRLYLNKNFWISGVPPTQEFAAWEEDSLFMTFATLGRLYDYLVETGIAWLLGRPECQANGVVRTWLFVDPVDAVNDPGSIGHNPFRAGAVYILDPANYVNLSRLPSAPSIPRLVYNPGDIDWRGNP